MKVTEQLQHRLCNSVGFSTWTEIYICAVAVWCYHKKDLSRCVLA